VYTHKKAYKNAVTTDISSDYGIRKWKISIIYNKLTLDSL